MKTVTLPVKFSIHDLRILFTLGRLLKGRKDLFPGVDDEHLNKHPTIDDLRKINKVTSMISERNLRPTLEFLEKVDAIESYCDRKKLRYVFKENAEQILK